MRTKNEIRKMCLDFRNNILNDEVELKSKKIINKLLKMEEYKKSNTVFVYMDFKKEVQTISLIKKMISEGKHVIVSYTDTKNTELVLFRLHNIEKDLVVSPFGYLEPKKENRIPVNIKDIDLILVPGVAFDRELNRIGFGKGYYDKILNDRRNDAKAIAIAYEFQVLDRIPYEEHDIKMDIIITEENIYCC